MNSKGIFAILKTTASNWKDDKAPTLGAALAYYTVFLLAPLLIIAIAIAGLAFGREAAQGQIFDQLRNLLADAGGKAMQDIQEALVVRVAILHDQRLNTIGDAATPRASPQAPRTPSRKRVIGESQFLDRLFHNAGEVLKGVSEIRMARHTALAGSDREIREHQSKAGCRV